MRGVLKQGQTALDTMTGNWLHHVDWEKGLSGKASAPERLWDLRQSIPVSSTPCTTALPSDTRNREDLVALKVKSL